MVLKRVHGWLLTRVWKKIKLHGTQTQAADHRGDGLWRRVKLHGSQTAVQTLTGFGGV